jgi:hypothetical protein
MRIWETMKKTGKVKKKTIRDSSRLMKTKYKTDLASTSKQKQNNSKPKRLKRSLKKNKEQPKRDLRSYKSRAMKADSLQRKY